MLNFAKLNFLFIIALFSITSIYSNSSFLKAKYSNYLGLIEKDDEIVTKTVTQALCFLNVDGAVYDINPLYNKTRDYQVTDGNYTMYFNFCHQTHTKCENKNTTAHAILKHNKNKNKCYSLGGSENSLSKWDLLSN